MLILCGLLQAQTNVIIENLSPGRFCYPGQPVKIKASIITQNCTISKVRLIYRITGEEIELTNSMITTNGIEYFAYLTNSQELDIEYRIAVWSSAGFFSSPETNWYLMKISSYNEEYIKSDTGGKVILIDNEPEDGSDTYISIPAYSLYENLTIGIRYYDSETIEINNWHAETGNPYLLDGQTPVSVYKIYVKNGNEEIDIPFRNKVNVSFKYFNETNENRFGLFYYDGLKWRKIESLVDTVNNTVIANITSSGLYGIFEISKEYTPAKIIDYISRPSFIPDENEFVTFGISSEVENYKIKILNPEGKIIRELTINKWDGRDSNGDIVKGGIYIYQIITDKGTITGIINVIR